MNNALPPWLVLHAGVEYEAALRKQHSQLHPRTDWAKAGAAKRSRSRAGADGGFGADSEEEEEAGAEGAEALLRSAGPLLGLSRGAGRKLPPGTIELSRLKDANQHEPNESVVRSVAWHPAGQLLMTAGMDKKIRLFQVCWGGAWVWGLWQLVGVGEAVCSSV